LNFSSFSNAVIFTDGKEEFSNLKKMANAMAATIGDDDDAKEEPPSNNTAGEDEANNRREEAIAIGEDEANKESSNK
jgi:hypothetical protein